MKYFLHVPAMLLCLVLTKHPTFAHHVISAKFNTGETVTLNGPATQLDWSAPHAHLFVEILRLPVDFY